MIKKKGVQERTPLVSAVSDENQVPLLLGVFRFFEDSLSLIFFWHEQVIVFSSHFYFLMEEKTGLFALPKFSRMIATAVWLGGSGIQKTLLFCVLLLTHDFTSW